MVLFADELVIHKRIENPDDINNLTKVLDELLQWCRFNKLTLNLTKTKCMYFSKQKIANPPLLKIGDNVLEYVNHFKYLGIIIDGNLRHYSHLNSVVVFLKQQLGILSRIGQFFNYKASLLYYYSYIHSKLIYGIGAWGGVLLASSKSNKLRSLQGRILKVLFGKYFPGNVDLNKCTGILKVDNVYRHKVLVMLYGIIYDDKLGFLYCNIGELLFQHRYQTRNKMLKVPKFMVKL